MSVKLAASPLTAALYGVLVADATLEALLTGGVHDDMPDDPTYPFAWVEVADEVDRRGLGTGTLPEVEVRLHVFSTHSGKAEAQSVLDRAIVLLKDATLTVDGWTHCDRVFYDRTQTLAGEEIQGVPVVELVAFFRAYLEGA